MTCSACGHENRADSKFCLQCGAELPLACARCGRALPPAARFCDGCGTSVGHTSGTSPPAAPRHLAAKILASRSALEGERRQVTVLFADVEGSTGLAERLDPEVMREIMDRAFQLATEEVYRYEGTVTQFTGDGLMAMFGAPLAHEDAPERAVLAGLRMQAALADLRQELQRSHGIDLPVRVGINSGPVVVGSIGDDLHMDYTAIGDTTNLAARLQSAAVPGTVLIGEGTARQVGRRFVLRPVGPLSLKGRSEPVAAYEVLRALPRVPLVAPSEHGLTPLVARAGELAALESLLEQVRAGRGQVAFVVGEAGIGKSRLLHEFRGRAARGPLTWLEGRCISFGRGIPFLPLIDVVKRAFTIEESDGDADMVRKVRAGLEPHGGAARAAEPHLRALLAVDPGDPAAAALGGSARRFAIFEALKTFLLTLAAEQPLVLLIEDLHWIDPASEEFLTFCLDAVAAARMLVVCTYRPDYRPTFGERNHATRLTLQPLTREETARLAEGMLDSGALPEPIRMLIAGKAEGNPFFIEEVTKSLLETGAVRRTETGLVQDRPAAQIVIPDTIQDVIMARIDRLGEEPKRAIQVASVIGREFALRLLQRTAELGEGVNALVGELRSLELIYEKSQEPELAYMFKHALTHDVAYGSLLVQRRKRLHHQIGAAVEELYADRLTEYWETLAHHFERAEAWPRAFRYLVSAGDKALAAYANREAVLFFERALKAAEHTPIEVAERAAILTKKGRAHFGLSQFDEAMACYDAALPLCEDVGARAGIGVARAEILMWAHQFDAALGVCAEAETMAAQVGDQRIAGEAKYVEGFVRMVRGDLEGTERCHAAAKKAAEATGERSLAARVLTFEGLRANWRGEYGRAVATFEKLRDELRRENELLVLSEVYSEIGIALGGRGDYGRALASLREGIALAESIGNRVWRARMWNTLGWILGEMGAHEEADASNRRCIEIAHELGGLHIASELVGNAEANLADAALSRGDLAGAGEHLAAVAAILSDPSNEWMTWRYAMHYRAAAAELGIARGDLGSAREHLRPCLETAERTRSRRYLVRATRLLAICHHAGGNLPEAERLLAETARAARELSNPVQAWQTLLAYGRVLHQLGRRDEAAAVWSEALDGVRGAGAALPAEIRNALFGSSVGAALQELAEVG